MKVKNIVFCGAMASILMICATTANATVETTVAQVQQNMNSEFKTAPNKSDYAVKAPDGTDSTLNDVSSTDYDNYKAPTTADGTNVKLLDSVSLDIAKNMVSETDYKYLSTKADGTTEYLAGDVDVDDLSKEYSSDYITTPMTVSTADASAPQIDLGTSKDDAVYVDGEFYLIKNAEGKLVLNGSEEVTTDNPSTFAKLKTAYDTDQGNINELYSTLFGYKTSNITNHDAISGIKANDNASIQAIVRNKENYTSQNDQFGVDNGKFTAYSGSLAETIDKADAATLGSAKEYSDTNLASAKSYADNGDATTLSSAKSYANERDAITLASANSYTDLQIAGEAETRAAEDAKLRSAIDANRNDIAMLDSKMNDLDENLSAGIASSVALSSVAVANVQKGEMSVGGGYGNYNSKSAVALGAALGITDNWSANAGVGLGFGSGSKASFRVGTNYKFKLF